MKRGLTFDDVALVPQFNNVESRTEPDLSTWMTKKLRSDIPIVPANMESVIGLELGNVIRKHGGCPIFHRFYHNLDEVKKLVKESNNYCFVSVGINNYRDIVGKLNNSEHPYGFLIDIAHGHDLRVMQAVEWIKSCGWPVIAGNVCTPIAYQDLVNAGADAVKVGIGPGAACTTRAVTGFGVPQFTAIKQCGDLAKKLRVPIIADGGIRGSRDCVLALAAGATMVMIGSLFAATTESAAEKWQETELYYGIPGTVREVPTGLTKAIYRGQASASFQNDYYGQVKKGTVPEGEERLIEVTGSANDLIEELLGGIRSGLTYGGARNIEELQRKAEFVEVTQSYHAR